MARWKTVIESKENADGGRTAAVSSLEGATATERRRHGRDEVKIESWMAREWTGKSFRAGRAARKRIKKGALVLRRKPIKITEYK